VIKQMMNQKTFSRLKTVFSLIHCLCCLCCLLFLNACDSGKRTCLSDQSTGPDPIPAESISDISSDEVNGTYEAETEYIGSSELLGDTDMTEKNASADPYTQAVPGVHTLRNLLNTAVLPLGQTMYVWGGGWNEEDTGAGTEARSIGISPAWSEFASLQDADYDYNKTRYQIHDGLDCSGYVGWVIYNTMESEDDLDGYVYKSTSVAETLADFGWGQCTKATKKSDWLPGDIASIQGHVWICLGSCSDGSVLLIHSSPPGVRICGTQLGNNKDTAAIRLAEKLMSRHYPAWYSRYPECGVSDSYLNVNGRLRWNEDTLPDCNTIQSMTAEEIADLLFHD